VAGTVIVPWYATGFRADAFEPALNELAAVTLRYGATSYGVYRARDDRYKFQQLASFEHHLQWDRYWAGPEMARFRTLHSGWYQVPLVYGWWEETAGGSIVKEAGATGNGRGAGNGAGIVEGESA
jgi:hypothetical protein